MICWWHLLVSKALSRIFGWNNLKALDSVVRKSLLFAKFFLQLRLEVHHGVDLLWTVAQQALQVADEPVHVSLSRRLEDNVLIIVISEAPRQLLIIHFRLILPDTPPSGNLVRVRHLELPAVSGPWDEVLAGFVWQELQDELPELYWSSGGDGWTSVATSLGWSWRSLVGLSWVGRGGRWWGSAGRLK